MCGLTFLQYPDLFVGLTFDRFIYHFDQNFKEIPNLDMKQVRMRLDQKRQL
jgi:hypothetical protein